MKPRKRKHYKAGHKYANTLLTSIRVGHSKLNSDTHKLGLSDTNMCPHCLKPETALHSITKCPHFAKQRQTVLEQQFIPKFKKPCLSIDSLKYLLKALNQTTLRWKESTQKFKKSHKHSYCKLNSFWISQQPPSLHLLIHQIIFYHNHTIYKLFTVFFITFPFSSFSSLIFSFFLLAVMSEW